MSEARWTPEQEQAIVARGDNILVAAAAGSGKTATLVERVIRRLTDPVDPIDLDQFLVVTFTEAAAAEMRERVAQALEQALNANPGDTRLQRQLVLLGRSSISTLHSFCLSLIRQYFYRLGLDPAVTVMGEHEALLLRAEVLDQLFSERFEEDVDGPFYALVDRYGGGRDDEGLRQLVLGLYDFMQSLPWPDQWLQESVSRFDLAPGTVIDDLPWWIPIRRRIQLDLAQAAQALNEARRLCWLPGGPIQYTERIAEEYAILSAIADHHSWDDLSNSIRLFSFDRLPTIRANSNVDDEMKKRATKQRDRAKKILKDLNTRFFARTAEEWLTDLRAVAPHLGTLVQVVQAFAANFRTAKAAQGAVDFNDLERFCLQLLIDPEAAPGTLAPSEVARDLRARLAEVLVDEYQDINAVQDAILTLVARAGADGTPNRFMVGDVKQSIYRFRHADPSLFLEKYQSYQSSPGPSSGSSGGSGGRRIVLGANFRSRVGVVDAVNFLFRQILTPGVGELPYDRDAELVYKADYPDNPWAVQTAEPAVELHILAKTFENLDEAVETDAEDSGLAEQAADDLAELSGLEREALLTARRIKELIEQSTPVWDRSIQAYRPLKYRDIAILLRATTGRANIFMEALRQWDIPAYAQLNTGYFSATEVEVMVSLLQMLDNPKQDIPTAAVLRSPIVGLSSTDLTRVRLAAPRGSFFDAVVAASQVADDTSGLAAVLARFLETLRGWRTMVRRRPLSQVIWQVFQETGYLNYVAGMPGGPQRHANLIALYDRARQFDQFARQGLFRFLRFIEGLREEEADMGAAPSIGEAADVVRIMSIHKSKGLEFPIVFVADMGKKLGGQDIKGDLLLQRRMGLGPLLVDPEQRIKYPTLAFHAVREAILAEAQAEEMRVLYVALTRARERLILIGSCRDLLKTCERWAMQPGDGSDWPLSESKLSAGESYLDWIGPAVARHAAGRPLRELGGAHSEVAPGPVADDSSNWEVWLWHGGDQLQWLRPLSSVAEAVPLDWQKIGALEPIDHQIVSQAPDLLRARFDWVYPHAALVQRFAKLTVTELKGYLDPEPAEDRPAPDGPRQRTETGLPRRPRFMQEGRKRLSPTELGTLMHLVLQHLDLTRPLDQPEVESQVQGLVTLGLITEDHRSAVDTESIAHFFASPLGREICANSASVQREVSFTLTLPVAHVYPDLADQVPSGDTIIVQGMIDLLLEREDGYLLVDYKTDKRAPADAALQYQGQIRIYKKAVQEILGRPVVASYLHFLNGRASVAM